MLFVAEFDDLVGEGLYVHKCCILVFLELQLVSLCVDDDNGRDNSTIMEASSLLHQLVNDIDRSKRLASQIIDKLFFELMQKDIVKNNKKLTVFLAGLNGSVRGQDKVCGC